MRPAQPPEEKRELVLMAYVKVLLAGVVVGVLYVALRVKAPAPPPVALCGLLGMLLSQAALGAL
ncbi:hypothetical protein GCM10010393_22880 [Streptomyces gobitricini]|uniref:XapX domain-containing protein n=1 Tax=Streptomyces gobitricini TaxID=68211 RepID=A0ABN3LWN9_9ACTN